MNFIRSWKATLHGLELRFVDFFIRGLCQTVDDYLVSMPLVEYGYP